MQEQECYPNNTFSDSIPDIDTCCGCIEDYDLSDWNDTPPIDGEEFLYHPMPEARRRGEPCTEECPECMNCTIRQAEPADEKEEQELSEEQEEQEELSEEQEPDMDYITNLSTQAPEELEAQTQVMHDETSTYKIIDL